MSYQSLNLKSFVKMEVEEVSLIKQLNNIAKDDVAFINKCVQISGNVRSGRLTILELIEQLGPLLVSVSPDDREKGTLVLSTVLENVPNDFLPAAELVLISKFYSDRLQDHHQIIPAVLRGLISLAKFDNISSDAVIQLLSALFENVPCQQQQQSDRQCIYQFFKIVLDKRKNDVKAMGLNFVFGVISAIDGERDPRNLLFLFNWLPQFLSTIDLGHLTEEMFEIMSCYFPIDFRAPLQDPNSISRDTLASALCSCLCAIPAFASYSVPLALEKLDSELHVAKLDSLNLLMYGCVMFPVDVYKLHSTEIWSLLQKHIINSKDQDIETKCLQMLSSFIKKLSVTDSELFVPIIRNITETIEGNLRPDTKLFQQSCKILLTTAGASEKSAICVINDVLPLLINLCNITQTPAHQVAIFKVLIGLVKAYLNSHENSNLERLELLKSIPSICFKATVNDGEPTLVSAGFESFAVIVRNIPVDIRNCLYEVISNAIVKSQPEQVRTSLLNCLKALAQNYGSEIINLMSDVKTNDDLQSLRLYLEAVAFVAPVKNFSEVSLHIIVTHLFNDKSSSCIALKILKNLLETGNYLEAETYLIERENILDRLVDWFLETYLEEVSPVLSLLIGRLSAKTQDNLVSKYLEKVVPLFQSSRNDNFVFLMNGLLVRIRPEVKIKYDPVQELTDFCLGTCDLHKNCVAAQLIGNIVNKECDDTNLVNASAFIEVKCSNALVHCDDNIAINQLVNLVSFVAKGLTMRDHELGRSWMDKLLEITKKHASAAKGFQIIMSDDYESFNAESHCNRRLLYRQKVFTIVTTWLCDNYRDDNENCLLILGYLLLEAPKQVVRLELKKVVKLIIMCLDRTEDVDVLNAVLITVRDLLEEKDPIAENYVQEFLTRMLKLSKFKKSMNVRILALKCISLYTIYPQYVLLPLRDDVICTLSECLDDPKRLVRKEAAETRSTWYLIGAASI